MDSSVLPSTEIHIILIFSYPYQNQTLIVEWYFRCNYDGKIDGFDGVTNYKYISPFP